MKRAGDWAMPVSRVLRELFRAVVPTTRVSGTVTSRLSPIATHDGRGSFFSSGRFTSIAFMEQEPRGTSWPGTGGDHRPNVAAAVTRAPAPCSVNAIDRTPAAEAAEDVSPAIGETYPLHRRHVGRLHDSCADGRTQSTFRHPSSPSRSRPDAARVCAPVDARSLAVGVGVAVAGRDRDTGVRLESLLELPVTARLRLRRLELVRDSSGESVSTRVAWPSRRDVASSGRLADLVRRKALRLAVGRVGVPPVARLVLIEAGA